jgi:hypothetical protein
MTATFGDFLRPSGDHIAAAVSIRDELSAEATFGVIRQFGRLLCTLVHYGRPPSAGRPEAMAAEPLVGADGPRTRIAPPGAQACGMP